MGAIVSVVNTVVNGVNAVFSPKFDERYQLSAPKVLYDMVPDARQTAAKSPISEDFKPPLIPLVNSDRYIIRPAMLWSTCKCLNPDGTVNKNAYLYNDKCMRCANPKDVFYARGALATGYTWSDEKKNTYISIYDVTQNIQNMPEVVQYKEFTNINDAKQLCETIPICKGVTRTYDANGMPYYALRAGSVGQQSTTGESSWERSTTPAVKTSITIGERTGKEYSTCDIPRAFADDVIAPPSVVQDPKFKLFTTTPADLINSFSATMTQAASAWATYIENAQNTNKYYQLIGVERQLKGNVGNVETCGNPVSDAGICVGPCDTTHNLHDPIQMIYDSVSGVYVLYGTTCHDGTQNIFDRPSMPAIYTPQSSPDCLDGYDRVDNGSSSKCLQTCESSNTDSGSTCISASKPRDSVPPQSFTCPAGTRLSETVCLYPCGNGYIQEGDYCIPPTTIIPLPSSIKCTKTSGGGGSGGPQVTKWLCDSEKDQKSLLLGPSGSGTIAGTSSYINKNDIICVADDASTGMYYCTSVSDALNNVSDTQRDDYSTSCDTLLKSYLDLSNNLTSILKVKATADNASSQLTTMESTIRTIITTMCNSGGSNKASTTACSNLQTQLSSLQMALNSGSSGSGVASPINVAVSSRDNLIILLRQLKCCSAGETYPWCDGQTAELKSSK